MPITAEQVIRIIDYAIESVRNAEKMRKTLKQIESDAKELLFEQDIREGILDRIAVIRAAAEDAWRYEIDMESLENLFKEKQRFTDNAKKNKNAARRMKLMRMVRKEREETGYWHRMSRSATTLASLARRSDGKDRTGREARAGKG